MNKSSPQVATLPLLHQGRLGLLGRVAGLFYKRDSRFVHAAESDFFSPNGRVI